MSFLTGKPQKSESKNLSYDWIKDSYGGPGAENFGSGMSQMANLLGLGAGGGGFDDFTKSAGYDWVLDQGSRAINGNMATKGLFKSGATGKALTNYGQNLGKTYLSNYLGQVGDMMKLGLGAGGLVSNAGQVSKGTGQTQGFGGLLGGILGGIL